MIKAIEAVGKRRDPSRGLEAAKNISRINTNIVMIDIIEARRRSTPGQKRSTRDLTIPTQNDESEKRSKRTQSLTPF